MATCLYCHEAITWARTEAGKLMPLDAEPTPDGNVLLSYSSNGTPTVTVLAAGAEPLFMPEGTTRHMPHFVTCPNYDPKTKGPKR